jgi:TPR repeat protein
MSQRLRDRLVLVSLGLALGCREREPIARPEAPRDTAAESRATSEDAEAQYALGGRYLRGIGVPQDTAKALALLKKAADMGHPDAPALLGVAYQNGLGVAINLGTARRYYQAAADLGSAMGQKYLADAFLNGRGGELSMDTAAALYAKAWSQFGKGSTTDDNFAMQARARMYHNGFGVDPDPAKALEWYRKAAEQGDASAQNSLGDSYYFGFIVDSDPVKALEWYRKAAEQGDALAQERVGAMYERGQGVDRDYAKALEWYRKAAEQGYIVGQACAGRLYAAGLGTPRNYAEAARWWTKAAQNGDLESTTSLVAHYLEGRGVPKDLVLAYAWASIAAAKDDAQATEAIAQRDAAEALLGPDELAEAQRIASAWKPGNELRRERDRTPAGSARSVRKRGTGTGFFVTKQGHVLTNAHVVDGCAALRLSGSVKGTASVVTTDESADVALLLSSSRPSDAATMAPDSTPKAGDAVVLYGYPLEGLLSAGGNLVSGIVSAPTGLKNTTSQFQITAPIQPGSSGSAVLNRKGHVSGMVSSKLSEIAMAQATGTLPQNVNFAITGATLRSFMAAHHVPFETGWALFAFDVDLADMAERARKWTVIVECWGDSRGQ